jgi:RHS repeat-associated protein
VLVRASSGGTTTRYTQDLAAPLAQVLSDNTHTYVYGHERLLAVQGDTRTWHLADALGSLRMTLDSTGTPQSLHSYDAWGVVQEGTPAPFGFTGEMQQAGLVYLRARWYAAGSGTFTSRDPFAGYSTLPNTLHPYMYAANTPLLYTDPSGRCYDQLGFLRDVEPGNCHNLDMAIKIFNHPNASLKDRTAAYAYISTWTASHAMLLVGAGILTWEGATAVSLWGSAAMANAPTTVQTAAVATVIVADKVDDALMYFYAALGDEQAVADYQALQQLGTSDPSPVCDVLAAGIIVTRRGSPDATFMMPQNVRKRHLPQNGEWIGRTFYPQDPALRAQYPQGVPFTIQGYPDFTRYARVQVRIRMTGVRRTDFAAANQAAGYGNLDTDTPEGFTWHHHHDRTTMQLVPRDLHEAVRHTGGVSVLTERGPLP